MHLTPDPAGRNSVLIVDDDAAVGTVLAALCRQRGFEAKAVTTGAAGLAELERRPWDAAIVDLRMPDMSGLEVLAAAQRVSPDTAVVMLTAFASVADAVRAMKLGAVEFMQKPFDRDELMFVLERALALADRNAVTPVSQDSATTTEAAALDGMLGSTAVMREVYELVRRAAPSNATVLVRGESGTGKELVARAIHRESRRAAGPFVKIHCAALPDNLLESELFGYEKGAFTGATQRKPGRIELAQGGTVFLDEIGDITPATQVKLLRVLQDKQLERLGATSTIDVDVRFVTATHRDLETLVKSGAFREDLFYRLNVVPVWLPPLRERRADTAVLAERFFADACREHVRSLTLDAATVTALGARDWPGNVRQLKNVVERLAILAPGPVVHPVDLERELGRDRTLGTAPQPSSDLRGEVDKAELAAIEDTLQRCQGNRTLAAKLLGVSRRTLYNKLARLGIGP